MVLQGRVGLVVVSISVDGLGELVVVWIWLIVEASVNRVVFRFLRVHI